MCINIEITVSERDLLIQILECEIEISRNTQFKNELKDRIDLFEKLQLQLKKGVDLNG